MNCVTLHLVGYTLMHLPINVKSPNNISKGHMEFNSVFKGLNSRVKPLETFKHFLKIPVSLKKKFAFLETQSTTPPLSSPES
jgi:hypothetical protein